MTENKGKGVEQGTVAGDEPPSFPIQINVVKRHDDGQVELTVSYSDEFKQWFMQEQGLKRWSEKRFQQVMSPLLQEYYDNMAAQQASQPPAVSESAAEQPEV